jgi:PAS domain S-box-containing protein
MEKPKILIVEDESIVAKDLELTLEGMGYSVAGVVASGEEAVRRAEEYRPDLVLMDIVLQGKMDGIEAADGIRSGLNIPAIYITAHTDEEMIERAKLTEPFGYLLKPFKDRELHSTIEMALYKHKMEKAVKESEEWLSSTLRSVGDAVIAADLENRVVFMNPVAEALTGWNAEDATGKSLGEVFRAVDEESGEDVESQVREALEGKVLSISRCMMTNRDGRKIPVSDSVAPIRDERNNVIGMVQMFRDVSGLLSTEEEPLKVREPDTAGVCLKGIAHDFNNLLATIFNNLYLAMLHVKPEDKLYKMLTSVEKATLLARHLTSQVSEIAEGGKPAERAAFAVPIAELIKDSAYLALTDSKVMCELSIPDNLWNVTIDEGELKRIIQNLVVNARDAMANGGVVKVRADNIIVGKEDELSLKEGAYVIISVEDHGAGIPEEDLHRIFDPYFTTRESPGRRVAGLGLSIVSSIVRYYGGHIKVESEVGVGTNVMVYLAAASR